MEWWGRLSHAQQVAVFVPLVCVAGVVAFDGLGDSWGKAVIEGGGILVAAVVFALVIKRQRQGSEKHRD